MVVDDPLNDILRKIERGELSADEGLNLINNLDPRVFGAPAQADFTTPSRSEPVYDRQAGSEDEAQLAGEALDHEIERWRRWWFIPFSVGIFLTLLGAGLMYWGVVAAGLSWGFWLSWIPFLLGQVVMILAWYSQKARWLHVRIRQRPGDKPELIAFSLPLPLRLGVYFFRHFGRFIPQLEDKQIDLLLDSLDQSLSSNSPFYVHVNDDGEDVQYLFRIKQGSRFTWAGTLK